MTTALRNDRTATTTTTTTTKAMTKAPAKATEAKADDADVIAMPTKAAPQPERRLPERERNAITTDLRHLFQRTVGAPEAEAMIALLAKLPAADFREVAGEIAARPEKFAQLMQNAPEGLRDQLTRMMVAKGLVSAAPGAVPAPVGAKAPTPPAAPALLRDDVNAPPALRELILEENLRRVGDYRAQYAEYREAYGEAVDASGSVAALRALKPMAPSQLPDTMPGAPIASAANKAYQEARGLQAADVDMNKVVADRASRLAGHDVMGISVKGELGLKVALGEHLKIGGKVEGAVGPDGEVEVEEGAEVAVEHSSVSVKTDGDEFGIEVDGGVVGGGVSVGKDGVELHGKLDGVTGKAKFNGDSMGFGVGVEEEFTFGSLHGDIEGGFEIELQGADGEQSRAFASTSEVGFYDAPPELAKGTAWTSLPESARARYEQLGWSEAEWKGAADLARFSRAGR